MSLGGVKYAVGLTACSMLAERIKTPEQRYLVIAAIGAGIGAIETAWRDYRKGREKAEREAERSSAGRSTLGASGKSAERGPDGLNKTGQPAICRRVHRR